MAIDRVGQIDPRVMKQLLQLELSPAFQSQANAGVLGSTSGDSSASLFEALLSQYMEGAEQDSSLSTLNSASALAQLALYRSVGSIDSSSSTGFVDGGVYSSMIGAAAAKYGVSSSLIEAVIATESGFRADAVSTAGAKGLMQLMDGTARGLGVTDSFDPQQNIEGGTKYLSLLLGKYEGNVRTALAAYNAGPGRLDRLGITNDEQLQEKLSSLPEETQRYVAKVMSIL